MTVTYIVTENKYWLGDFKKKFKNLFFTPHNKMLSEKNLRVTGFYKIIFEFATKNKHVRSRLAMPKS